MSKENENASNTTQQALLKEWHRTIHLAKRLRNKSSIAFFDANMPGFHDEAAAHEDFRHNLKAAKTAPEDTLDASSEASDWGHPHHGHAGMNREFHRIHRQISAFRGQGRLLHLLTESEGMQVKDVAEAFDIRPSSASELVAKLEARGLVRIENSTEDRRVRHVYITDAGRDFVQKMQAMRFAHQGFFFAGLDADEQDQLLALLRKMNAHMAESINTDNNAANQPED